MTQKPFVYWKEPGKDEIFTILNPIFKKIKKPEISIEGFLFYPYKKNGSGYFIKGEIEKRNELDFPPILSSKTTDSNFNNNSGHYISVVNNAIKNIKSGFYEKVVLARTFTESLSVKFRLNDFFKKLINAYPNSFVYCIGLDKEIWIGASPEVFLKKEKDLFLTYAMAGTRQPDSLTPFGTKEKAEQEIVKNYILNILNEKHSDTIEITHLEEINTGNLKHLITEIKFKTQTPLEIIQKLHPTPAVCGTPLDSAAAFIKENEKFDRAYYSGFLGPVYENKDFSLWVNLRCAKINAGQITYYAGAGIVAESQAEAEWLETERKMDTLRLLL